MEQTPYRNTASKSGTDDRTAPNKEEEKEKV